MSEESPKKITPGTIRFERIAVVLNHPKGTRTLIFPEDAEAEQRVSQRMGEAIQNTIERILFAPFVPSRRASYSKPLIQCNFCGSFNVEVESPSEGLPEGWIFVHCLDCPIGEPRPPIDGD